MDFYSNYSPLYSQNRLEQRESSCFGHYGQYDNFSLPKFKLGQDHHFLRKYLSIFSQNIFEDSSKWYKLDKNDLNKCNNEKLNKLNKCNDETNSNKLNKCNNEESNELNKCNNEELNELNKCNDTKSLETRWEEIKNEIKNEINKEIKIDQNQLKDETSSLLNGEENNFFNIELNKIKNFCVEVNKVVVDFCKKRKFKNDYVLNVPIIK